MKRIIVVYFLFLNFLAAQKSVIPYHKEKKWGLKDLSTNKFIVIPKYDSIGFLVNNKSFFKKSNKWGIINSNGKVDPKYNFDDLITINFIGNSYKYVGIQNNKYYFLSEDFQLINESDEYEEPVPGSEEIIESRLEDKLKILNVKLEKFNKDKVYLQSTNGNTDWNIGKVKVKSNNCKLILGSTDVNELIIVIDGKYGIIEPSGNYILPIENDFIAHYFFDSLTNKNFYIFKKNELFGILESQNINNFESFIQKIVQPKYLKIKKVEISNKSTEYLFVVRKDGAYGYMNLKGQEFFEK